MSERGGTRDTGCVLCARRGDFGPIDPARPHSGLCPRCRQAARPTRQAIEQAVVIVAGQSLQAAEAMDLAHASPEELAYHVGALKRSVRSLLLLVED
ncbi:hypothetical protein [Streptomyces sp. YIM 98790]|uniref:hypothetical protein n=1 Tax=Streptomyces sp. YIM 98790 TaxID=2689077 RepID=UPI00140CA6D1|nr:hypothetical protein [Streptomyces sp. YIM 98790]